MIGGGLGQFWSFRAIFLFLVLLSLAIWVYAFVALPETYDISERQSVNLWPIVKRLVGNVKVLTYGCLIGAINGVIFSYYAEAPFIFIETFDLSPLAFGLIGILVASASVIGAQMSKRLIGQIQAERIILWGIGAFIVGSGWQLLINRFLPTGSGLHLVCILSGIFVMLIGLGMALPNCLSLALVDFQDVIGSASALFSLGYYFLVSLFTYGMSFFHNGSLGAMPLYFLVIGSLMWWLTRKFLISSK
ncbi:MFS transporter [Vagococcus allomyrinae]|uniref:MFS transporter n=1 Tax=Vagococcus allomyrinae TaxID=2794353 RepID=UPI0024C02049|nr:MFS transporter [Vagococcus allomyrinae]